MRALLLVFPCVGLLLLVICGGLTWRTENFIAQAETASGVVVGLERFRDFDTRNSYLYSPVVRFETRGGQEVTFTTNWRRRPAGYRRGDAVEVLYPAGDPQSAAIIGIWSLWGASIITGIIGVAFSFFGILFLWLFRDPDPAATGTVTRG